MCSVLWDMRREQMLHNLENFDLELDLILFLLLLDLYRQTFNFLMESMRNHSTPFHAPFHSTSSYSFRENNSGLSWKIYWPME